MSDAQYVIDIAARMSDGPQTVAQLDELTSGLLAGGKNADFFADAIARVGGDLAVAKAQATAANEALAAGNAEFSRLERAANEAARALEKAEKQSKGFVSVDVRRNALAANAALEAHKTVLAGLESDAAKASAREKELGGTLGNLKTLAGHANKSLADQAERLGKLQSAVSSLGGPIGGAAGRMLGMAKGAHELSGALGSSSAAAVVATTVFAAVAAVAVAGGIALASFGIGAADSRRNVELLTEAMKAQHPILVGLDAVTASLTRETGMHADELQKLALKLDAAKVAAEDMPAALRAAALAETALGQGGADAFIADIRAGKTAVGELAAATQAKFGGIVAQQMRGLSAQSARLSANLAETFGGLNIEPVLDAVARLVGLFDQQTAAGQALKFVFESLFQPIVNGVDSASVVIEAFVLRTMIWGLRAYLGFKKYSDIFDVIAIGVAAAGAAFVATFIPGAVAAGAAAVTAGIAAVAAFAPVAAAALAAAAPFVALGVAVAAVYMAFTHWEELVPMVQRIGADIIAGLSTSITNGASAVWEALGGVVTGAINRAKELLGIASPSKVFAGIGENTVLGFTGAVEDGQADAEDAMTGMVAPSTAAAAREAAMTGGVGSAVGSGMAAATGGVAVSGAGASVSGNTFNLYGVKDADDAVARIEEVVTRLLEGDALQAGATA